MNLAERAAIRGNLGYQVTMILCFLGLVGFYGQETVPLALQLLGFGGAFLFLYCLFKLYPVWKVSAPGQATRPRPALLTTGPFKYTRHPMYTGLFLMALDLWVPGPASLDWPFFMLSGLFLVCMVIAGYYQEQETLARFGEEAAEYYKRTPRFFFMYPFISRKAS